MPKKIEITLHYTVEASIDTKLEVTTEEELKAYIKENWEELLENEDYEGEIYNMTDKFYCNLEKIEVGIGENDGGFEIQASELS